MTNLSKLLSFWGVNIAQDGFKTLDRVSPTHCAIPFQSFAHDLEDL